MSPSEQPTRSHPLILAFRDSTENVRRQLVDPEEFSCSAARLAKIFASTFPTIDAVETKQALNAEFEGFLLQIARGENPNLMQDTDWVEATGCAVSSMCDVLLKAGASQPVSPSFHEKLTVAALELTRYQGNSEYNDTVNAVAGNIMKKAQKLKKAVQR